MVDAFGNLTIPDTSTTEILGVAIALNKQDVSLLQGEARDLTCWHINFLDIRQIKEAVLNIRNPKIWLLYRGPFTFRVFRQPGSNFSHTMK